MFELFEISQNICAFTIKVGEPPLMRPFPIGPVVR